MQFKNLFNHGKYGDAIKYNVLLCKQQYSEKNIAIKSGSLCVYMRSGTRLYVEGDLTDIFKSE